MTDPVNAEDDLVARSRSYTENFSYDIAMVRGLMRQMADRIEALEAVRSTRDGEIERYRSALQLFVDEYVEMVNSGDCGFWNAEDEPKVKLARQALNQGTDNVG